ncbi:MAG: winged helix-turn-helix transcriptional regulator [Sphingomonas phyllosphaerae]
MALLDLVGRRWTLRILWELRETALTARALRERCDCAPPSSLNARLHELRHAGLVAMQKGHGYYLTAEGAEFVRLILPLYGFAERWAERGGGTAMPLIARPS